MLHSLFLLLSSPVPPPVEQSRFAITGAGGFTASAKLVRAGRTRQTAGREEPRKVLGGSAHVVATASAGRIRSGFAAVLAALGAIPARPGRAARSMLRRVLACSYSEPLRQGVQEGGARAARSEDPAIRRRAGQGQGQARHRRAAPAMCAAGPFRARLTARRQWPEQWRQPSS